MDITYLFLSETSMWYTLIPRKGPLYIDHFYCHYCWFLNCFYTFLLEGICLKWSVKVPYGCNKLLNISSSYLPTKIQRNSIDILPSYLTMILFHTYQFKNVFIIYKYVYLQRPWFSEYHTNVLENTGVIFFERNNAYTQHRYIYISVYTYIRYM